MRNCELNICLLLRAVLAVLMVGGGMGLDAANKAPKKSVSPIQKQETVNQSQQQELQSLLEHAVTKLYNNPPLPLTVAEGDALIGLVNKGIKDSAERETFIGSIKRAVREDLPPVADQPVSCCPSNCDSNLQKTLCLIRQLIGDPCDEETLFSLLCFIRIVVINIQNEAWSIESKAEVISSKLDNINVNVDVSTIISKIDQVIQENWSIESKAEVISSKIDVINNGPELWSIESKAEVISSKIDNITQVGVQPELWSIESKAEVISSKIDALSFDITVTVDLSTINSKLDVLDQESWSIESKAEVISSKIDVITVELGPFQPIPGELWSIESKAEVISSKIDLIHQTEVQPELWSIESKAEVISSKIDNITQVDIQPELWSIESKAEIISSKLDDLTICVCVTTSVDCSTIISKLDTLLEESWSIESKAEVISSKIDNITPVDIQPELWSIESKAEVISSKIDNITIEVDLEEVLDELWSIESKAEIISSKIDDLTDIVDIDFHTTFTMLQEITNETWSIESKAEVISSKIGNLDDSISAIDTCATFTEIPNDSLSVFQWLKLIYRKVQ